MDTTVSKLTVFFEDPFWVGIYEREFEGRYEVCKITFGAEPRDYEVYGFFEKSWRELRFSPSVEAQEIQERHINPKRMQREINRQLNSPAVGTKAQQALKLSYEQGKLEHKANFQKLREEEKERQFAIRQEKKKEKHRGH